MCEWERRLLNNNYKQIMRVQENIQLNTACVTFEESITEQ